MAKTPAPPAEKAAAPSRLHLFSTRKIDSAEVGGGSRVRKHVGFHADHATGNRLVRDGAAVPFAERPAWARNTA